MQTPARRCAVVGLLSLTSSVLSAQTTFPQSPASAAPAYADESAVVQSDAVVFRMNADGTGTRTEAMAIRIQSPAAVQGFAVLGFPYASQSQTLSFAYARVRKPDSAVVSTPVTDVQDQPAPATQLAPMYSDIHVEQLPVRSLAVGDLLEFEVDLAFTKPEVPGEFWGGEHFGMGLVFLERTIELHVPATKAVTVFSPKHPPLVTETPTERVYRWKGSQLKGSNAKDDPAAPPADKLPPIAWTTFPGWEAVGLWYAGLIAGRDAVTPAIQAKADELTAGAKTDADKVRLLYEYVAEHNHYIAIGFGIGRLQPHTAAEVLANQYGDCKDKHTLLAALLRAKGFHPEAVLIGSGVEFNEKVPSPASFNHLITRVDVDATPVWLDSTTEVAPYRVLLPALRDKTALVVPDMGSADRPRLAKTPATLPFPAVDSYDGSFQLADNGTTKGTVTLTMRGDDEVYMRFAGRQVSRAQWDTLGQAYVENNGFFGKATATALGPGQDSLALPWSMQYQYTQDAWSQWKQYQMGSLLPNVGFPSIDENKPPTQDIDFGGRHTQTAKSVVHLPPGYSAELPDAIHLHTPFATFDETYKFQDGSVVSEFALHVLEPKVGASEWKSVKKMGDAIGVQPWIQLTAKSATLGASGPPPAGLNNPAAAALVREVHDLIVAKNLDAALSKNDQAIALNTMQPYVWSQRGFILWQKHNYPEAATSYERELQEHPEELDQYPGLVQVERLAGRPAQAETALLSYAKAAPENQQALLFIGAQLTALNHPDEAVAVYRNGLTRLPGNRWLQLSLGSALLKSGQPQEGVALLQAALRDSDDPSLLNDGAYALLSDPSNAELPLAETSARKAVDLHEAALAATPLESVNTKSFRDTLLLLASWDTLGWVYYTQGKYAEAAAYVRAAWQNTGRPEEGLHMGQLLLKAGDRKGAMRVFELALSRTDPGSSTPVTTELQQEVDRLAKQGIAVQETHPSQALQEQRTFHVPRPVGVTGSGIFLVQASASTTEHVLMLSGDDPVRPLAASLQKLNLGLAVPAASHVLLLRSGVLHCSTQTTCEFVLTPPETANIH